MIYFSLYCSFRQNYLHTIKKKHSTYKEARKYDPLMESDTAGNGIDKLELSDKDFKIGMMNVLNEHGRSGQYK